MSKRKHKSKCSNTISPRIDGKPYLEKYVVANSSSGEVLFDFWVKHDENPHRVAEHWLSFLSPEKKLIWDKHLGRFGFDVRKKDCENEKKLKK